ncbi:DUF2147 domain-containing protein [Bradyrhizobium roseum]|uniref:DUF2147 domain-containing protein n=1 Tax=Bradyrhizobium roseum TaxID=3056648 RepID=UPI002617F5E8|nr:DUF2147 domain-containing protein [Bradyrhizobium roseus]WKA27472.1 DUF2147 domain-containing protein [Bradyrhizobium roseus]
MKRLCFLAVLLTLTSSAHAGRSISFSLGKHRVHVETARHCRSLSCTSVSISKRLNWRHRRDRYEEERDATMPVKPVPSVPQTVSPPAPPPSAAPPKTIVTAPDPVYTAAASRSEPVEPPPLAAPAVQDVAIPVPPAPSVAAPVEAAPPPPQVQRVLHQAEEETASDSPIGDWQTEGKGKVRIGKCGDALCGFVLDSGNERGEAILINMKPKTQMQWTGGVYSQSSAETYFGTMSMKGINTLRVEACALGRFYCSGNNWSRITRRADGVMTSRQMPLDHRS